MAAVAAVYDRRKAAHLDSESPISALIERRYMG